MAIESINPATGETLKTYAEMSRAAVDDIIVKAHEAFLEPPPRFCARTPKRMRA